MASWLLGFSASWLLGFSASWLFGFSASWLFGLCGFWRLWLVVSSAFTVPFRAFWLLHPFIGFGCGFPHHQHHQFLLFESSLLRTSWRGSPPQPRRYFLDFLQSNCTPMRINASSNIMGGAAASPPQSPRNFLDFLQRFICTPYLNHHFFERPISRENAVKIILLCKFYRTLS